MWLPSAFLLLHPLLSVVSYSLSPSSVCSHTPAFCLSPHHHPLCPALLSMSFPLCVTAPSVTVAFQDLSPFNNLNIHFK